MSSRLGVAIRDLEAVGRVIDAALGAGATGLDGVSFGLADTAAERPGPRPMARMTAAMAADVSTPVLPGRVEVTVSVVATWELD